MKGLLRVGAWCFLFLLVLGYIGFRLLSWRDQALHRDEYNRRVAITYENAFDANRLSDPENALRIVAVNVVHTPLPFSPWFIGYGVFLGDGLVVTAAHVIGRVPFLTRPRVFIGGQDLAAKVLKEGAADRVDLAILKIDQDRLPFSLRVRRTTLCRSPLPVGEEVLVAYPEKIVGSRIISPKSIMSRTSKFTTFINEEESSGTGVFDAQKKCLLGIISERFPKFSRSNKNGSLQFERLDYAGYFVPAVEIEKMLGGKKMKSLWPHFTDLNWQH